MPKPFGVSIAQTNVQAREIKDAKIAALHTSGVHPQPGYAPLFRYDYPPATTRRMGTEKPRANTYLVASQEYLRRTTSVCKNAFEQLQTMVSPTHYGRQLDIEHMVEAIRTFMDEDETSLTMFHLVRFLKICLCSFVLKQVPLLLGVMPACFHLRPK